MHLILSGGGNAKKSKNIHKLLISYIHPTKKTLAKSLHPTDRLLYIPIAMPLKERSYVQCYDWLHDTFKMLGFENIDMWTDLSNRKLSDLKRYEAVYIGGGNTYYLLSEMKRNRFDRLLLQYAKEGGIIFGGSAGAIILGKDIETSHDKNEAKLKDLSGIDIIQGNSIWCHYQYSEDKAIFAYVKKHGIPVIAIPEESGVIVKNGKLSTQGSKKVFLFTADKKQPI
jgi:dipeptidase E